MVGAENVGIKADNIYALIEFALESYIYITVFGPEAPLVLVIFYMLVQRYLVFGMTAGSLKG